MFRRWRVVAAGVCLASTGAATAKVRSAKPPAKVVLDYRRQAGAEACPTRPELESQVREILGRTPFARNAPRTVRCVLQGEGGALAARVQLVDSRSGRVLGVRDLSGTGPGCEELGGAVALAIALAIDPLARPPRPPPAATVTATPPLPPSAAPPPVPPAPLPSAAVTATPPSSSAGRTGAAASAFGVGAAGVSGAPRTGPPTRGLLPDAGPLGALGLGAVALAADAGRPPPPPDAGARMPDAGVEAPDAGTTARDAGLAGVDAGTAARDAGLVAPLGLAAVALVPTADAGRPPLASDAGPPAADAALAGVDAGPAGEGGEPALVGLPDQARSGWRPVVGIEALGAAGVLPGFAGGALIHAGAASSTASIEVEGRWLPGTQVAFGTGTVSTSLISAALVGCARFGPWGACGVAQAGPLSATGQGYSRSQEASPWMVSAGARAQWEWLFADPVGLRLHLDGAVNLVRPRFLVDSQEAWGVPPFSVWVGGGLFGRF